MSEPKYLILHTIDSLGCGGGQALLFEFFYAIKKYYPEFAQNILLLNDKKKDEAYIKSYGLEFQKDWHIVKDLGHLNRIVNDSTLPTIFLYHNLLNSNGDVYRKVYGKVPVIVLNHTHSDSIKYNVIKECNGIVSVCKNMQKRLYKFYPRYNHYVIYNGVNQERYDPIEAIERQDRGKGILITGRCNGMNDIKYSNSWTEWVLNVHLPGKIICDYIGGGSYYKRAKSLIESNKKSRNTVNLLGGIVDFEKKVKIIKSWDIFLYEINRNEGLSISMLEALSCGVPVICSDHYGNKEIIEPGVNGFVYESRIEAEEILTELMLDPDKLEQLKETTKQHFRENLDAEIMVRRYVKLFKKVLDEPLIIPKKPSSKPSKIKTYQKLLKAKTAKRRFMQQKSKKEKETIKIMSVSPNTIDAKSENFTILTSGYNKGEFVKDWAKSVLAQKYRPLEAIYVDDHSKDKTMDELMKIAQSFKDADITLKVFRNKNRLYCASSYQHGWENGSGPFFGVLDADDMLTDDAVEYVMKLYEKYPDVTYIYTQFDICDTKMKKKRKGFCYAPPNGTCLLDLGKRRKHVYSHWRTFSKRCPKLQKIWKPGLRSAVDKFMGYRLEEWGTGMFADHVCYLYREGVRKSVSNVEQTKVTWQKIVKEARNRRKKYKLNPHPIIAYSD